MSQFPLHGKKCRSCAVAVCMLLFSGLMYFFCDESKIDVPGCEGTPEESQKESCVQRKENDLEVESDSNAKQEDVEYGKAGSAIGRPEIRDGQKYDERGPRNPYDRYAILTNFEREFDLEEFAGMEFGMRREWMSESGIPFSGEIAQGKMFGYLTSYSMTLTQEYCVDGRRYPRDGGVVYAVFVDEPHDPKRSWEANYDLAITTKRRVLAWYGLQHANCDGGFENDNVRISVGNCGAGDGKFVPVSVVSKRILKLAKEEIFSQLAEDKKTIPSQMREAIERGEYYPAVTTDNATQ